LETIQANDVPIASPRDGEHKVTLAAPWIQKLDDEVIDAIDLHYSFHPLKRQAQPGTQKA
jgi:hypothetical protein